MAYGAGAGAGAGAAGAMDGPCGGWRRTPSDFDAAFDGGGGGGGGGGGQKKRRPRSTGEAVAACDGNSGPRATTHRRGAMRCPTGSSSVVTR